MLDARYTTFATLSDIKSYTKTAQALHITQPAVTQHIQYLERLYNCKLFVYKNKTLQLTEHGQLLYNSVTLAAANSTHLASLLAQPTLHTHPVLFGATLTIGEYCMPPILAALINRYPQRRFTMTVENTENLLDNLDHGQIEFALLEGFFDKSKYDSLLFSLEDFIPVCAAQSPLAGGASLALANVTNNRLILREKGSGTREILENILQRQNFTLDCFAQVVEVGNMAAIKQLVRQNLGIAFLYKAAVQQELNEGSLATINIQQFSAQREFNFVFLKNSLHRQEYVSWYNFFKEARLQG
ncbi:MAG: LysR family transcriptional regulator [Oscillospiraceae bacterium]